MSNRQIQIDFSAIKDIADRGVRRTSVFMGIGINAILDKTRLDYDLTKITQLQIVPLHGELEGRHRYEVGGIRIVYEVHVSHKTVEIKAIRSRGDV